MQFIKKIKLDESTFMEYNLMIFRKKNIVTWVIVGIAVMLAYVYLNGAANFLLSVWIGAALGGLFLLLSYGLSKVKLSKNAKAMYEKQSFASLNLIYTINGSGVSQGHNRENFTFPWSNIKIYKETDLAFYFFYARYNALVVSKETLLEDEMKMIRKLAETNLPKKKRKS
jgi:hypothetical protein